MAYRREDHDDDELSFSNEPIDCCVSIVDMVGSTRITANIRDSHKLTKCYSIFINNMSVIGKKFGALISKFAGDSLVLYFPQTSNKSDKRAFKNVIECGITMLAAFNFINSKMSEEDLPFILLFYIILGSIPIPIFVNVMPTFMKIAAYSFQK